MRKKIAWGASKLLKLYLAEIKSNDFKYCLDNYYEEKEFCGLPVKKINALKKEKPDSYQIVIFAASSKSLQEISQTLSNLGLVYGTDYIYYSDLFLESFIKKVNNSLGLKLNMDFYSYALSFTLNSKVPLHTTILGTWLFIEILRKINRITGEIAEVGSYEGGNALCALNFMAGLKGKRYYLIDSFEGFNELGENDPKKFTKGDYKIETSLNQIKNNFKIFPQAAVLKGYVPQVLEKLPPDSKYSLVFYDCDLYQPALDTFEYFWKRISKGGYLIVHDYVAETGGFTGVKKASDEFFGKKKIKLTSFFENTMAVIKK